jgi:predicted nucleic acid-binding protein
MIWRCAVRRQFGRRNGDFRRVSSSCSDWMPVKTTASTSRFPPGFMQNADQYGSGTALVFDTSAWNCRTHPTVLPRWAATRDRGLLAVSPIVALELLAAARDEPAFQALDQALDALPSAPVIRAACDRALGASRELRSERRLPAADYMIAAAAARARLCGSSLRSPLRASLPRSRDREHLDCEAPIDRLSGRQASSGAHRQPPCPLRNGIKQRRIQAQPTP